MLKVIWKAKQLCDNYLFWLFCRKWSERMVKCHQNLLMRKKVIFVFVLLSLFSFWDVHFGTLKFFCRCLFKYLTSLIQLLFAEKLYDFLNIQLESDLNLKRSKISFLSFFSSYFFTISLCCHYLLIICMWLSEFNFNFFLSQCGTMK